MAKALGALGTAVIVYGVTTTAPPHTMGLHQQGMNESVAKQSAADFRYGNAKAPAHSPTNNQSCLWCEASRVSEMIRQLQAKGYIVKVRAMASRRPR